MTGLKELVEDYETLSCDAAYGILVEELEEALEVLEKLRKAYFLNDLEYFERNLLKSNVERLIVELEKIYERERWLHDRKYVPR